MTEKNFIEWDEYLINVNLITQIGIGENEFRPKEDGSYSLFIKFCGTEQNIVEWYVSKKERDKDYKKLKELILNDYHF